MESHLTQKSSQEQRPEGDNQDDEVEICLTNNDTDEPCETEPTKAPVNSEVQPTSTTNDIPTDDGDDDNDPIVREESTKTGIVKVEPPSKTEPEMSSLANKESHAGVTSSFPDNDIIVLDSMTIKEEEDKTIRTSSSLTNVVKKIKNFLLSKTVSTVSATDSTPNLSSEDYNTKAKGKKGKFLAKRMRNQVILAYPQMQGPRQPFMKREEADRQPPNPPVYYRNALPQGPGAMVMMPNLSMNISYWAPYPDRIPANVPACLAHLVAADSLFIIQQMDMIELFLDITEPNYYLIQNTTGQCLYYAYETSDLCVNECCKFNRGFQLHVMDMYHNEIIYINKPCGCNNCFCCFPVLEVYSPPMVPVGAVTQTFNIKRINFVILDADENKAFSIHGPCCCGPLCSASEADFTIHALDEEETEVGIIRRQYGGYIPSVYTNTDYYGISFPVDLDVRIKAAFLGALFLIVRFNIYQDM